MAARINRLCRRTRPALCRAALAFCPPWSTLRTLAVLRFASVSQSGDGRGISWICKRNQFRRRVKPGCSAARLAVAFTAVRCKKGVRHDRHGHTAVCMCVPVVACIAQCVVLRYACAVLNRSTRKDNMVLSCVFAVDLPDSDVAGRQKNVAKLRF
jgi:hypothetical protein